MLEKIKKILVISIIMLSLVSAWAYWSFENYKKYSVPILAYHKVDNDKSVYSVSEKVFDEQLNYLHKNGYKAITLEKMQELMKNRQLGEEKYVVITFDDGYENNYTKALPILQKYNYPATIFVVTGSVGATNYLSPQQIMALSNAGIEIGSHTDRHLPLATLSLEEVERELIVSKQYLEYLTLKTVKYLAYPNGSYNDKISNILKKTGYEGALTGVDGVNEYDSSPYYYYRVNMFKYEDPVRGFQSRLFRAQLKGWYKNLTLAKNN